MNPPQPREPRAALRGSTSFGSRGRVALGTVAALCAALALAVWLRSQGIGFLLPHHPEPDGGVIVFQLDAHEGRVANPESHPYWGYYPHLLARVASWVPDASAGAANDLAGHLARAASSALRVRETIAGLSVLGVAAVFALARRFVDTATSFVAALLAASSFLGVWFADESRPHAAAAAIFVVAVLAAVWVRRSGSIAAYLAAAFAVGCSAGTLQSGIATAIPLVVASRLAVRREHANLALAAALALAAFIAWNFYPPSLDPESAGAPLIAYDSAHEVVLLKGHQVMVGLFDGGGFAVIARALYEYEPVILALALVALGVVAVRRWNHLPLLDADRVEDLKVVIAFVLPYTLVIGLYSRSYQRFALPLVPFACVIAAWLFSFAARRVRARELATCAFALPFVAAQVACAWRLCTVREAPDTLTRAAAWVTAHVEASKKIAVLPGIDLPLATTDGARLRGKEVVAERGYPWTDYQNAIGEGALPLPHFDCSPMPLSSKDFRRIGTDAVQYVRGLDADYALVEVYRDYWRARVLKTIYDGVALCGERVARFAPEGDDLALDDPADALPFSYQDDAMPAQVHWLARTWRVHSTGPVLELYRLR